MSYHSFATHMRICLRMGLRMRFGAQLHCHARKTFVGVRKHSLGVRKHSRGLAKIRNMLLKFVRKSFRNIDKLSPLLVLIYMLYIHAFTVSMVYNVRFCLEIG